VRERPLALEILAAEPDDQDPDDQDPDDQDPDDQDPELKDQGHYLAAHGHWPPMVNREDLIRRH
jgi:hypothetical protein